jgi:hypothetical protein
MLIWSTPNLLSSIALMGIYSAAAYSLPNEQQRKALKELKMINDVGKTIIQRIPSANPIIVHCCERHNFVVAASVAVLLVCFLYFQTER